MEPRQVYLDNNATTPLHPEVVKALTEAMELFGNPSSLHGFGRAASSYVQESRERVAAFIGAEAEEIVFVASGSEGNNSVLSIMACPGGSCSCAKSGTAIVTSTIEHPCVLETAKCLAGRGSRATFVPVDESGKVDLAELEEAVTDETGVVSIMMANNEIGTVQDLKQISEIVRRHGARLHTDAVQAVGKIPVNVEELGVDFLTMSAHKIYGPKGIGALYVRRGTGFCPLIHGGHQEQGRRAGTENTLGIIGMAKAIEMRGLEMDEEENRLLALKTGLRAGLEDAIPDIHFNGHPTDSLPGTLNVSFDGAEGESILLYLDFEGIAVSTGSACASGSLDPSHVLRAIGVPVERAHGSIRISMGRQTAAADVDYVLDRLPKVIDKVRSMSTVYARS